MINNNHSIDKKDAALYSPLTLAYLGDCVFELMVREKLILQGNKPNGKLHLKATDFVSAAAQSDFCDKVMPLLEEDEIHIYKRGRNSNAVPHKNTDPAKYIKATGLEALFGYLYLSGQTQRLEILFNEGVAE